MTPDIVSNNVVEKERALEAVLKSRTFARSDQLQGFLRYICEMELAGRGHEITEYSIATGALHRPSDYAPSEDSSVRSRAHSLRHKLHEFYESEAPDAEWHIELPKGSYRPQFVKRTKLAVIAAPAKQVIPPEPPAKKRNWIPGAAVAAIAAALALGFVAGRQQPNPVDAIVREAWGPALGADSEMLVVVGCAPLARISRSPNGLRLNRNPMILAPPEILSWYDDQNLGPRPTPLYLAGSRGYIVFADMLAVNQVTSLLTRSGTNYQSAPETVAPLMAIHERGLVIIGAPAYTGIAARVLKAMPFSIRYDEKLHDEVITDGRTVFAPSRDSADRFSTVYGLITVLPSQPGRTRPERTFIFSGITGSPGAQAGVQYFTSPAALKDLEARFRKDGHGHFPAAYQVVVKCGVDKEAAINSVYETHRVMGTTPVIE